MQMLSWRPCAELAPYVERYWTWASGPGQPLPILLPGTGNDLFIHDQAPFAPAHGRAQLLCVRTRPWPLKAMGPTAFMAIRFRMGALRHFSPVGLGEIFDQAVAVESLWGPAGQRWVARILAAPDYRARMVLIEAQLLDWLRLFRRANRGIDAVAAHLYYEHATCRIEDVAARFSIGRRHMERTFKEALGVSPKAFQRLARFQQTVRDLWLAPAADGLATALAHGYFDQSHFIREFESFAHATPAAFLASRKTMAHFYNPPHSASAIRRPS